MLRLILVKQHPENTQYCRVDDLSQTKSLKNYNVKILKTTALIAPVHALSQPYSKNVSDGTELKTQKTDALMRCIHGTVTTSISISSTDMFAGLIYFDNILNLNYYNTPTHSVFTIWCSSDLMLLV